MSAALPGQVDARLHVDGLELRGWTRYQSIRFTDRTLTAVVQSACNKPVSTLITHDHVRSAHGAWMAGPCRIPKLTVRVRFPSPAPHAKSVAAQANPTVSLKQVNAHSGPKTALVPLRVPLTILASAPGDCQFDSFRVVIRAHRVSGPPVVGPVECHVGPTLTGIVRLLQLCPYRCTEILENLQTNDGKISVVPLWVDHHRCLTPPPCLGSRFKRESRCGNIDLSAFLVGSRIQDRRPPASREGIRESANRAYGCRTRMIRELQPTCHITGKWKSS